MNKRTSVRLPAWEVDPAHSPDFRTTLGRFASGVVVVTGLDSEGTPVGMTCQSFTSLSLHPPLVCFSPSRSSTTFPRLRQRGRICINVLAEDQDWLSDQFAMSGTDKWAGVEWVAGSNGAPQIADSVMWCDGTITEAYEAGDHYLAIVAVEALALPEDSTGPLIFHRGAYRRLNSGQHETR